MAERSRHGGGRAAGPKNDHIYFFVPDEKVDIACLAAYLKQFVDASVTIKPSRHPREPDRLGYTVGAGSTLSKAGLQDVVDDSADWDIEKSTSAYKREPYDYPDSDTWQDRLEHGQTPAERPPVVQRRRERREKDERRYDSDNPKTYSTVSGSTDSTYQSSIFSRGEARSNISDEPLEPSDSASQAQFESRHAAVGRAKNPYPKGGPNQPDPDSYNRARQTVDSLNVRGLSISDTKPNQSAQRSGTNPADRHGKGDDNRSGNRSGNKGVGQGKSGNVYDPWN